MLKHFLLSSLAFSRSPISKCHDVNRTKKSKSFVIIKKYTYIHRNFTSNHRKVLYSFFLFQEKEKEKQYYDDIDLSIRIFSYKKKEEETRKIRMKRDFCLCVVLFLLLFYDETIKSIDWNVKNKTKTTNIYCDDNDMP